MRRRVLLLASLFTFAAVPAANAQDARAAAEVKIACVPQRATAGRPSPYDSVELRLAGQRALLCYSRPSARGRVMIGGEAVPYGELWRTGANEPTIIHLPVAATIAGVKVEAGSYSLYTIPGENEWRVLVNRSITQWGHEGRYTDAVKAQEVGRGVVKSEKLKDHVEMFTIQSRPAESGLDLILEWEKTRVVIPVRAPSQ